MYILLKVKMIMRYFSIYHLPIQYTLVSLPKVRHKTINLSFYHIYKVSGIGNLDKSFNYVWFRVKFVYGLSRIIVLHTNKIFYSSRLNF